MRRFAIVFRRADQRGRELPGPGVSPRVAWDAAQSAKGDATPTPGAHGIVSRPPSVAEPAARGDAGAAASDAVEPGVPARSRRRRS